MNYKDLSLCLFDGCDWVYPTVAGKCPRCGFAPGVPISIGLDTQVAIDEMLYYWKKNKKSLDKIETI